MEQNVAMGARAVKIKVGGLPIAQDAERVRVARDAVGPEVKLLVDANCAYRAHEAIRFARKVEAHAWNWCPTWSGASPTGRDRSACGRTRAAPSPICDTIAGGSSPVGTSTPTLPGRRPVKIHGRWYDHSAAARSASAPRIFTTTLMASSIRSRA